MGHLLYKAGWLRAFFDGEGSAILHRRTYKTKNGTGISKAYHISLGNTDKTLVDTCSNYLNAFGIRHTVIPITMRGRMTKPAWSISIASIDGVQQYAKYINFTAPSKRKKLRDILHWIYTRPKNYLREANMDLVAKWYWEDELTMDEICSRLGLKHHSAARLGRKLRLLHNKPLRNHSSRRNVAARRKPIGGHGDSHASAKLSSSLVKNILIELQTNSCRSIAANYGVSPSTIERIQKGKTWKRVKRPALQ